MIYLDRVKSFENFSERYDKWFDDNPNAYLSEIKLLEKVIPNGLGLEVGVGTGRFSKPFYIEIGLDPSIKMGEIAKKRGIKLVNGIGENLPFKTEIFDFVVCITTICFLKNIKKAFKEAYRVLKKEGKLILGFIDKNSALGIKYFNKKERNPFYKVASFYSVEEIINLMEKTGFIKIGIQQTIFRKLEKMNKIDPIKKGYGKGSFISMTGIKKFQRKSMKCLKNY